MEEAAEAARTTEKLPRVSAQETPRNVASYAHDSLPVPVEVYQGNLGFDVLGEVRWSAFRRSDPGSPLYRGVRPEFGVYDLDRTGNPVDYESRRGVRGQQEAKALWDRVEVRFGNTDRWK